MRRKILSLSIQAMFDGLGWAGWALRADGAEIAPPYWRNPKTQACISDAEKQNAASEGAQWSAQYTEPSYTRN